MISCSFLGVLLARRPPKLATGVTLVNFGSHRMKISPLMPSYRSLTYSLPVMISSIRRCNWFTSGTGTRISGALCYLRVNVRVCIARTMTSSGRYVGTTSRGLTKEFSFPVSWGQVSGKTWGDSKHPPILCLHGWLDNCNSFDKLIPLLPSAHYYVAFDMPGHGFSSHLPLGAFYITAAYCSVIKRLIDYFKFQKVTVLGHSMGGNVGAFFGSLYPEIVDRIILIDTIGVWFRMKEALVTSLRSCIDTHIASEKEKPQKEYTYELAKERLKEANKDLDDEAIQILLERGMKELKNGNFVFTRDVRHLFKDPLERNFDMALAMMENIKADIFIIAAKQGMTSNLRQHLANQIQQTMDAYKEHSKSFQLIEIDGNHHLHLCTPSETAKEITAFLQKHPIEETTDQGS